MLVEYPHNCNSQVIIYPQGKIKNIVYLKLKDISQSQVHHDA